MDGKVKCIALWDTVFHAKASSEITYFITYLTIQ